MKRHYKQVIGYGSVPNGHDIPTFVWHVHCHEPMKKDRGFYMLSVDSCFHPGYDFCGAMCEHCKQPMPVYTVAERAALA